MQFFAKIDVISMLSIQGRIGFASNRDCEETRIEILPNFAVEGIEYSVRFHQAIDPAERHVLRFEIVVESIPEGWGWREFHAAFDGVRYRMPWWGEAGARDMWITQGALRNVLGHGKNPPEGRSVAVLIRTHISGSQVGLELAEQISRVSGWDVFFAVDETKGPIDTGRFPKLPHTHETCAAPGLIYPKRSSLHHYGDYALYASVAQLPPYDFYFMIEYDVALHDAGSDYWQRLCDALRYGEHAGVDYVGARLHLHSIDRQAAAAVLDHPGQTLGGPPAYPKQWKAILPLVGVSARAVPVLLERRLLEQRHAPRSVGMNVESFIPTVLMESGDFGCVGINALIPGSTDPGTCNTREGRPYGFVDALPSAGMLIHPVNEVPAFLRRFWKEVERGKDPGAAAKTAQRMLDWIRIIEEAGSSSDALHDYRGRAREVIDRVPAL